MTNKINGCPYKASNNGQCTHKTTSRYSKQKRYCGHEYPHNCPMFMDWLESKRKSNPIPINPPKNNKGDKR